MLAQILSVKIVLHISSLHTLQYNSTEEESVVYPVRERVSGKLNPEGIPEGIPCPALTTGATSCTVKIPENEDYVFNLTVGNAVGNTSVQATFNREFTLNKVYYYGPKGFYRM